MSSPRIHLTTCFWGDWHREIMQRVMLPTLLADRNLPTLAKRLDARYRISTTAADRARLAASSIGRRLAETVPIEWVTERADPDIHYHVDWYHAAIAAARAENAFCLFLPPDVAWSDGTLGHAADVVAAGKLAAAMPYLRVISETALPEIAGLVGDGEPNAIAPGELVRLGVRHMHPLSAAALNRGRHARPSLEALWRVPGEGLVFRHMVRELFVFDPGRIELSHLWYAGGGCTIDDIHVVTDSDDMFMLSFAPLMKDIPIYIPEHAVRPIDLARQSLHPLNDTPLTSAFARRAVRLHYGAMTEWRWRRCQRASDRFIDQAVMMREGLRIWRAIQDRGCTIASRLISVALQATRLARGWRHDGPVAVFVPTDAVIARDAPGALERLAAPVAEPQLIATILAHVAPAHRIPGDGAAAELPTLDGGKLRFESTSNGVRVGGARVLERIEVAPHQIFIIDRWLAPPCGA